MANLKWQIFKLKLYAHFLLRLYGQPVLKQFGPFSNQRKAWAIMLNIFLKGTCVRMSGTMGSAAATARAIRARAPNGKNFIFVTCWQVLFRSKRDDMSGLPRGVSSIPSAAPILLIHFS